MPLKERILEYVSVHPGATDTEIAKAFGVIHQQVNAACRTLEREGRLIRKKVDKYIGNFPVGASIPEAPPAPAPGEILEEEDIKRVLTDKLTAEGWTVATAWGHAPGVDLDARRGNERWLIEVKGSGSRPQMRVNYFLSILGESLQRMDDPAARYSIALPDLPQYRGLWERLPVLAKQRTGIGILFVDEEGNVRV